MPLFLVFRQQGGPLWKQDRPLEEQAEWRAHAEFMNALEADDSLLLAGPFGGSGEVLLVMRGASVEDIGVRLDADPWTASGQLTTTRIEPWTVRLGRTD